MARARLVPARSDHRVPGTLAVRLLRRWGDAGAALFDQRVALSAGHSAAVWHLHRHRSVEIEYIGLDIIEEAIDICRRKHPENVYICGDILEDDGILPEYDYAVMNGVFTEKGPLPFDEMFDYFAGLVARVFEPARFGIAFNVMSAQVDWTRDDLFHLPLDRLAEFVIRRLNRRFVIRNDYGLYEYTTYVYKWVPHTNVCTIQPPAGQPRRGKRLRMCSCPRISGEVVYRSVDGRLRGPRFWWGACSTAAGPTSRC